MKVHDHHDQGRRSAIFCPHCRAAMRGRSNREVTPTYRQLYLACVNPECGATYAAELTITHIISQSACPNPAVNLRQAPPRNRRTPVNDTHPTQTVAGPEVPAPANDDGTLREAIG